LRKPLLSLLFAFTIAAPAFAVTYVVPADRFEIERAAAIITGRVLGSRVENGRYGIETVTSIALEEALKGNAQSVIDVHEPGGVLGDAIRLIPGVPTFADGDRVLLLLYQREDGSYTVSDMQLGAFRFAQDVAGRELAVRNEAELDGWDPDGRVHQEQHRAAEPFLSYVRKVVRGEAASEDYVVSNRARELASATGLSVVGSPLSARGTQTADNRQPGTRPDTSSRAVPGPMTATARRPAPDTVYTTTSYMLYYSTGLGTRWNVFPAAVNWNQGNSETGALGSGTPEISAAFNTWNAAGAHYVLAGANANTKGFLDPFDGVNNFVFEKNLTSAGVQPFSCVSGGVLGMGGMTHAGFGGGTHVFHGETFATTLEADVSMNQGLSACNTSQVTHDMFKTVILHELGHTLGLRHSDQNRQLTAACSTDPTLDCSSTAVMNHILVSGLNGVLQPWDSTAMNLIYGSGPPCIPPSILIQPTGTTITSGSPAQLAVSTAGTAPLLYQWFTGPSGDTSTIVGGAIYATLSISPGATTTYWVRVTGQCVPVANSSAATVTVIPCVLPQILSPLPEQTIAAGATATLTINYSGAGAIVHWYQGAKGDTSTPLGAGPTLTTPPLVHTTQFWARVTNGCGSVDSNTETVTVTSRNSHPRAVRH
jgi:hypothetical protein